MANVHWANAVSGNFVTADDWAGDEVPGVADTAILDAKGAAFTVTSAADQSVAGVQTVANATLAIGGDTTFTIAHGTKGGANAGTIAVAGSILGIAGTFDNKGLVSLSTATMLIGDSGVTFDGGGRIVLSAAGGSAIDSAEGAPTFTNVDNTLSGAGQIGGVNLINRKAAIIDADAAHTLTIGGTGTSVVNAGTIEETGTGGLSLANETVTNSGAVAAMGTGVLTLFGATLANVSGGKLTAAAGAHISLEGGGVVTGGSLTVAAGATLSADSAYGNSIAVASLTNLGVIAVSDSGGLTLAGSVTNNGTIQLDSAGHVTTLRIGVKGVTLGGGGQVALTDDRLNYISGVSGAGVLTNFNDDITGAGNLGLDQLALDNKKNGVINATGQTAVLTIQTGLTYADSNEGVIESTGAAGMVITATRMANTGTVDAKGSGALVIQGATITSTGVGKVSAATGAHISLKGGGVLIGALAIGKGATLTSDSAYGNLIASASFSNLGTVAIGDGDGLTVSGSIINKGEIQLNSAGALTGLTVDDAGLTLSGGGQVVLSDNNFNYIGGVSGAAKLTNIDNTISGSGGFGNHRLSVYNAAGGVIDASGASHTLTIDTGIGYNLNNAGTIKTTGSGGMLLTGTRVINTGMVKAVGSGALTLQNATVDNSAGGEVAVLAGARISLRSGGVNSGVLSIADSASLGVYGASYNYVFGATLINQGDLVINDAAALHLTGSVNNTGVISLNASRQGALLSVGSTGVTLDGGGRVMLSNSLSNDIGGITGATLTNVDNRISGGGEIGGGLFLINEAGGTITNGGDARLDVATGSNTIVNAGQIIAAGGNVIVGSAVANTGMLIARVGGVLTLQGTVTGAGEIEVQGGTVDYSGAFGGNLKFGKTGNVILQDSRGFTGTVSGFSDAGKTSLDLHDIDFAQGSTQCAFVDNGKHTGGVLTVSEGSEDAVISLVGDFVGTTFTAASDGAGGSTVVDNAQQGPAVPTFLAAMAGIRAPSSAQAFVATDHSTPHFPPRLATPRMVDQA